MAIKMTNCIFEEKGCKRVTVNTVDGIHEFTCACGNEWKSTIASSTKCKVCEPEEAKKKTNKP